MHQKIRPSTKSMIRIVVYENCNLSMKNVINIQQQKKSTIKVGRMVLQYEQCHQNLKLGKVYIKYKINKNMLILYNFLFMYLYFA